MRERQDKALPASSGGEMTAVSSMISNPYLGVRTADLHAGSEKPESSSALYDPSKDVELTKGSGQPRPSWKCGVIPSP